MKMISLPPAGALIIGALLGAVPTAFGVESNFLAKLEVFTGPGTAPSVGYEVPAGENFVYYTTREVGDDITLASNSLVIASIAFEYYASYALTGGLTFRMYEADVAGRPGQLIYTQGADIQADGGIVKISFGYSAANVLPQNLFYTVEFAGQNAQNRAGLIVPDREPVVGESADLFWERQEDGWTGLNFSGVPAAPRLELRAAGDGFRIEIRAESFATVVLEAVSDLGQTWLPLATLTLDAFGQGEYTVPPDALPRRFFRLQPESGPEPADPPLRLVSDAGTLRLEIQAAPLTEIELEAVTELGAPWQPLATVETDATGRAQFQPAIGVLERQFFRIKP